MWAAMTLYDNHDALSHVRQKWSSGSVWDHTERCTEFQTYLFSAIRSDPLPNSLYHLSKGILDISLYILNNMN